MVVCFTAGSKLVSAEGKGQASSNYTATVRTMTVPAKSHDVGKLQYLVSVWECWEHPRVCEAAVVVWQQGPRA